MFIIFIISVSKHTFYSPPTPPSTHLHLYIHLILNDELKHNIPQFSFNYE